MEKEMINIGTYSFTIEVVLKDGDGSNPVLLDRLDGPAFGSTPEMEKAIEIVKEAIRESLVNTSLARHSISVDICAITNLCIESDDLKKQVKGWLEDVLRNNASRIGGADNESPVM